MGVSGQHHAPAALYPWGKGPPVPIVQEAGWAPELVWTQRQEEKSSSSVGDRTPVVQSVASHYTDWATAAHNIYSASSANIGNRRILLLVPHAKQHLIDIVPL
jgi:hypothetical protein